MTRTSISLFLFTALAGCGGGVTAMDDGGHDSGPRSDMGVGTDSGSMGTDSGSTGTDSGATGTDSGPGDDAGTTGTDSGTTGTDSGPGDDAGTTGTDSGTTGTDAGTTGTDAGSACAGMECPGFTSTFVRGCTFDDNCVGELHELDCCGAQEALGMNHAEASVFCPAETACRTTYPSPPGCSDTTITTDTGESTNSMANVAVHCVPGATGTTGTCTTFVCGTAGGTPCPSSRRIGTCGP